MSQRARAWRRPGLHIGICANSDCAASMVLRRGEGVNVTMFRTTPHLNFLTLDCPACHRATQLFTGLLVDRDGRIITGGLAVVSGWAAVSCKVFERASKAVAVAYERTAGYPPPMPPVNVSINKEVAAFAAYLDPIPNISDLI